MQTENTPSNSSSLVIPQPTPTVLRVRRKRGADPYEAFVVSLKKPRKNHGSDPNADGKTPNAILYSLTGTSSTPDVSGIDGLPSYAKVIDFQPPHLDDTEMLVLNNESNETSAAANDSDEQQYLNTFSNAVGEGSSDKENIASTTKSKEAQITVNGEPMISVKESVLPIEADYVFDFYWNPMGIISDPDALHIRLANKDEIELYCGEDTESSGAADDEDDSNDENNWRNDYPDEESHSSESSEEHYYDDIVKQFDDCGFDDESDDGSD